MTYELEKLSEIVEIFNTLDVVAQRRALEWLLAAYKENLDKEHEEKMKQIRGGK